jgi:hypothetical protein
MKAKQTDTEAAVEEDNDVFSERACLFLAD